MRASLVTFLVLVALGCNSIRDREVRTENVDEVLAELRQSNDVTPEEATLFGAYVVRSRLAQSLGAETDATLPATVEQMIERQRAFNAELEARERLREAEEAREREAARLAIEQRNAEIEALRASIPAHVTAMRYVEANWRTRRYQDALEFEVRVTNSGERAVRGVRGRFVFLDTFGAEVSSIGIGIEQDLAPGTSYDSVFSKDYNQFMEEDRALRGFDLARGTVRWEPTHVVYADGSETQVPTGPSS